MQSVIEGDDRRCRPEDVPRGAQPTSHVSAVTGVTAASSTTMSAFLYCCYSQFLFNLLTYFRHLRRLSKPSPRKVCRGNRLTCVKSVQSQNSVLTYYITDCCFFLFGIFSLILDMTSMCIFTLPSVSMC